jgi:hypothetical protein
MMRKALDAVGGLEQLGDDHLYALNRKRCAEVHAILAPAIAWWSTRIGVMKELEPANGWGDERTAYAFWSDLCNECKGKQGTVRMNG